MNRLYETFLTACGDPAAHRAELEACHAALKDLPVVCLEAECGLAARDAVRARGLVLVCGAYLCAQTDREREKLAQALFSELPQKV